MPGNPNNPFSLTRAALIVRAAQKSSPLSIPVLRVTRLLYVLVGLLALGGAASAQVINPVEPALPGSVQYWVTSNNYTWVQTSTTITVGSYVEDLLADWRWNQPLGRGRLGIVTATNWNADYNCMAATVDFWRDYSVGLVFYELSAIELVPIPEPSHLLVLLPGMWLARAALNRRRRAQADS